MEGRRDLRPDAWDAGPPWERVTVGTHGRRGPADARVLGEPDRAALFERDGREHPLRRRPFARMIERGVPAVEFVWVEVGEPPA